MRTKKRTPKQIRWYIKYWLRRNLAVSDYLEYRIKKFDGQVSPEDKTYSTWIVLSKEALHVDKAIKALQKELEKPLDELNEDVVYLNL